MPLPTIFDTCHPRPEVLAGDLPDAIFVADLWEVIKGRAQPDYQDPRPFFANSHPAGSLAFLLTEVAGRLAGRGGGVPVFRLETGFGGGKTHSLIAAVHVAHEGANLATELSEYNVAYLPAAGATGVAAFVGEQAD
jgi:predicted AAA+ superfamily ATPase